MRRNDIEMRRNGTKGESPPSPMSSDGPYPSMTCDLGCTKGICCLAYTLFSNTRQIVLRMLPREI